MPDYAIVFARSARKELEALDPPIVERVISRIWEVDAMTEPKPKDERKPTGSGYFAALCGAFFMLAFVGSFFVGVDQLSPDWVMRGWLFFVSAILVWWGSNRVRTGRPDQTVGQDTINLVIALVGATVALLGLFKR